MSHISPPLIFAPFKLTNISIQKPQIRSLFISLPLNFKGLNFAPFNFRNLKGLRNQLYLQVVFDQFSYNPQGPKEQDQFTEKRPQDLILSFIF